jgi:ribosomal protein L40E
MSLEDKVFKNKPICFKCGADITSFTFIEYPLSDKLLTIVFCKECGAVQGIVAKER